MKTSSQWLIQFWKQNVSSKLEPLLTTVLFGGITLAGVSLWGFGEIAEDVLDQETQAIDTVVLQWLYSLHTPLRDQVMIEVTFWGNPSVLAAISAVFSVILLLQRRWVSTIVLAIAVTGGIALNYLLKDLFARDRPELWERILEVSTASFPSGHAMISLIVYGFIGYWVATRYPAWRILSVGAAGFLIITIGLSRLYLGVHWPTDVVAGYAAGLVWLLSCILSLEVAKIYAVSDDQLEPGSEAVRQED